MTEILDAMTDLPLLKDIRVPGFESGHPASGDRLDLPEKIAYLASYGNFFISLVSDSQQDQELVREQLIRELDPVHPVAIVTAQQIKHASLLHLLSQAYGLQSENTRREINFEHFSTFVRELAHTARKPVLIVPAAQRLKEKELYAVLSFCDKSNISLVLFGTPALIRRTSFRKMADRIYIQPLQMLDDQELRRYIRQRSAADLRLSDGEIDNIMKNTGGSLERVDEILDEVLIGPPRRLGIPFMHMSAVVVLATVLAVNWFWHEPEASETSQSVTLAVPEEKAGFTGVRFGESAIKPGVAGLPTARPEVDSVEPAQGVSSRLPQSESLDPDLNLAAIQSLPATAAGVADAHHQAVSLPVIDLSPATIDPLPQQNWLMQAADGHYTLQLMGSHTESRIIDFIESQGGNDTFAYFETLHRNQSWFVLTVGQYASRDAALGAISGLPPQLQAQKPWARRVGSIRQVMR